MSLRLLAPGTGSDGNGTPAIDIVAVHGLNPINSSDHAFNTWRKPLDNKGCLWLRDCFPKAQPNARIYLYEYNSSPVFGSAKDSFVREANQLLDEIYGERWQTDGNTPLILVGHSLGGILIKQALVNAWANQRYRGIKEATHALVFFGTPHAGPSHNLQVGLGMACARIARSLPYKQTSKIVEILEGGTLFSDLLSESFRHQLEQYKILSCYEGLGDIVPFDSAVLGLPGQRETQLRINADHSNMCRFDLTVQLDKDNYRKVERNLQMLCADALTKNGGQIVRSDAPIASSSVQGGVDLSRILLQQLDPGSTSTNNVLLRSFADIPDLAWQVYQLCEQSRSTLFTDAVSDVSRLFIGVRTLKSRLETDTFSTDNTGEIEQVLSKCFHILQSFQSVLDVHQYTPQRSRGHWNNSRLREEFYGLDTLQEDLQGSIESIQTLNRELSKRSMNDLTRKLDQVIETINSGDENLSVLSSSLSRASIYQTSLSDAEGWGSMCADLVEAGLSRTILSEQGEYIQQWLLNAVKAGAINIESFPDQTHHAVSPTCQRIEPDESSVTDGGESTVTIADHIANASLRSSFVPTRRLSSVPQQPEVANVTAPVPPINKRASKGWAYSLTSKLKYATLSSHEGISKAIMSGDPSSARKILASSKKFDQGWCGWRGVLEMTAKLGYTDILGELLARGACEGRIYELGQCLSAAIYQKNVTAVTLFLEHNAPVEPNDLVLAMTFVPERVIERMLEDLSFNDLDHERYAHLFIYYAAKHDQGNAFRLFVAQYGGINAAINETTPFHLACRSGNAKSIQLSLDLGGNVRVMDARGDNPLHALILGGGDRNYEIGATIMLLVRNGVDLSEKSGDGKSALHLAASCAHIKAMEALLQMGLSPDIQTTEGKAPLHFACNGEWAQRGVERWLPGYLKKGFNVTQIDLEILKFDMKDTREDVYYPEQADEAIKLLLRYGASVNVCGIENVTPLHLASQSGKSSRIEILLHHGANAQAVDDWRWTPLHFAIISAKQKAIDLLAPYGVDKKKQVPVKIMGEHREQMTLAELLQIVNKGAPGKQPKLHFGDGDPAT
ncbi:uncharacterized protein BDV14DRAFT_209586 [Aspergillus stella-maris]|uniref:uncharacterized protein n=1 Tax=Aspergillus stella-maris TaxID=1810926 RepID=UPI003CCCC647